jgi:hypothetical protein
MNDPSPHERSPSPQYTGTVSYQSPGAHQKSQWVTDEGAVGKVMVGCLIVASVVGAVLATVGGVIWWYFFGW